MQNARPGLLAFWTKAAGLNEKQRKSLADNLKRPLKFDSCCHCEADIMALLVHKQLLESTASPKGRYPLPGSVRYVMYVLQRII